MAYKLGGIAVMKPIETETTNFILKGKDENVVDLPVTRIEFNDGTLGVASCWQLSDEEVSELVKTTRLYFCCLAPTHAPSLLSAFSVLSKEFQEMDNPNIKNS